MEQDIKPTSDSTPIRIEEAKFRLLVSGVKDYGIFLIDPEGFILSWNAGAESITGYPETEVIGKHFSLFHTPDSTTAQRPEKGLKIAVARGKYEEEGLRVRKDGSQFWADVITTALVENGKLTGFAKIVRDITHRKAAETEQRLAQAEIEKTNQELKQVRSELEAVVKEKSATLERMEQLFFTILDNSPSPVWVKDTQGRFVVVNKSLADSWGFSKKDLIGRQDSDLMPGHPDLVESLRLNDQEVVLKNRPLEVEERLERNGKIHTYYSVKFPILDSGEVKFVGGIAIDMTEQVKFRNDLQNSRDHYVQLAEAMPQIVFSARADGYVDYLNRRWHEFTGAQTSQSWTAFVDPQDLTRFTEAWNQCVKTEKPLQIEIRLANPTTKISRWHLGRAVPVRNNEGKIEKWYGTLTDINDQKRLQEELFRSNAEFSRFAMVASHDLKEPLRVIATYVQLIQKTYKEKLDDSATKYSSYIVNSVRRMFDLIDGLLYYSRVGSAELNVAKLDTNEVVAEALANLKTLIEERQAKIVVPDLPPLVGDKFQLVRLMQNLIGNGVKYRHPDRAPEIKIGVLAEPHRTLISVADNGIGVAAKDTKRIFEIFERLHSQDKFSGSGIGLALCKKIVERHQGQIWIESEEGRGSTVYVALPLPKNLDLT